MLKFLLLLLCLSLGATDAFAQVFSGVSYGTTAGTAAQGNDSRITTGPIFMRMQCLGDSKCTQAADWGTISGNGYWQKSWQLPISWAEAYSGGMMQYDTTIAPPACGGVASTVLKLVPVPNTSGVLQTGSGYTGSETITVSGTSGYTFVPTVTGGHMTGATVSVCGAAIGSSIGYPQVSITGSSGTGAVLTPVIGGIGAFAVAGQVTSECQARLQDVINQTYGPKPDILIVQCGRNDLLPLLTGSAVNVNTVLTQMMSLINQATAANMLVVLVAEHPNATASLSGTAGNILNFQKSLEMLNQGFRMMAAGNPTLNPTKTHFLFADPSKYMTDASGTAYGSAAGRTTDGIHDSAWGAAIEGRIIERALRTVYQQTGSFTYSALPYDATYNPAGNLLGNWQTTTGGTETAYTGVTYTGAGVPSGWTIARNTGSATATITTNAYNPTSAAPDATGQATPYWTIGWAFTGNGTATEAYYLNGSVSAANVAADLSIGDVVQLSCELAISNVANLVGYGLYISTYGVNYIQQKFPTGQYFPPNADALVGTVPPSDAVQPFRLVTPPYTIQSGDLTNKINTQFNITFDASASPASSAFGGTAGATATTTLRNCQFYKTITGGAPAL